MTRLSWRGVPQRWDTTPADNWRDNAGCRDTDPDLFFPVGTTGPALLQVEQAKAVCRRCPVTDECLRWAVDSGQSHGIAGGMTEEERRSFKRRTPQQQVA